jgi:hypothetical protein
VRPSTEATNVASTARADGQTGGSVDANERVRPVGGAAQDARGGGLYAWTEPNLHIVERFTLVDPGTLEYRFTADDPKVWTRPWTAEFPLHRTNEPMYEFACHEGNFQSMEGLLRVARFLDKP